MPQAHVIHSNVMLLLRREALSDYSIACANAHKAAERCAAVMSPTSEMVTELRTLRATVVVAAEALELIGDDVAAPAAWNLPLDGHSRDLTAARVRIALDRISGELESSEHEILEAAEKIECLRAMLDKLDSGCQATSAPGSTRDVAGAGASALVPASSCSGASTVGTFATPPTEHAG